MNDLKKISIVDYLSSKGINPEKKTGNQCVYFSPINTETTPSFFVEPNKNVFYDWSNGSNGDIIDLVRVIEKLSFKEAIKHLSDNTQNSSFSFSGQREYTTKRNLIEILGVREVLNPHLIEYIKSRKIDIELAKQYLKEIHYTTNDKRYYALGFKNDSGGYELRNGLGFKGKTKNDITTFKNDSKNLTIFEGFFDFLSALQYYSITKPNNTTIILNTTNNLPLIKEEAKTKNKIYAYLDNDKSGQNTINKLLKYNTNTFNKSIELYPNHKDFNHFLVSNRIDYIKN